jgi:chemotaxis protein MotB
MMSGALTAVVSLGGLMGCSGVSKKEYDAVFAEAVQLRDELATSEERLAAANARASGLEQDLLVTRGELDRAASAQVSSGTTGFENISGATISGRGQDIVVGVAGDVLFDSGKVTLKRDSKSTLDRIAGVISAQYAGQTVRVEGYTDGDPIVKSEWKTNERLSAERAMAVEAYLVSKGVSSERIYAAAFGDASPKPSKSASRRVEIVILGG